MRVNARFTMRPATGVDTHAREVLHRLDGTELIVPPRFAASGVAGHLWEQTALPLRARGRVLWSPCNTGPVVAGRHLMTIHDVAPFDVPEYYTRGYRSMARSTMAASARRAARIATVSSFSARRIALVLGVDAAAITVVGNGVRPDVAAAEPTAATGPAYLLTVGSLDPRKRLDRLVDAYRRVRPDTPLRIVGGSNERVFAEHGIAGGDGVELLGYVPDEQLAAQIAGARAFFSFSAYEGFGMPPVDAAASGVPVVVSDIESHREVLGGVDGVYFAANEVDLEEYVALGAAGALTRPDRASVLARHSWDAVAARYADLLREEFGETGVRTARPGE